MCTKECKDLKLTWSDFQSVLSSLASAGKVTEAAADGGGVDVSLPAGARGALGAGAEAAGRREGKKENTAMPAKPPHSEAAEPGGEVVTREETIPKMVAQHLLKNGKRKLTNVEVNAKVKIRFLEVFLDREGDTRIEISGESEARIRACMVFVDKFKAAFKKAPSNFDVALGREDREAIARGEEPERKRGGEKRRRKFY